MGEGFLSDLRDKVVFITGGSRGIGEATALAFAKAGARVAVFARKQEALDAVATQIASSGGLALALAGHAGKQGDLQQAIDKTVSELGGLDILVNNAATNPHFGPILDATESMWDKILEVNVKGAFFAVQAAVPHLEKSHGVVVNVASVAGLKPSPMMGVYSVSKAALIHLTKVLARELSVRNIRVNCVAPGLIKTKFSQALWSNDAILDEVMKTHALQRIADADEVANAILYLASSASSYATGSVLLLDGGELLY